MLTGVLPVPNKSAGYTNLLSQQNCRVHNSSSRFDYSHLAQFLEASSLSTVLVSHYHQLTKQALSLKFASFVIFLPSSILIVFVEQIQ